jgi:AhpD family alkylhydroperoxidase
MSRPRIEPATRKEAGWFAWGLARTAGLVARTNPPHLFLTMAHQRRLFRGWLRFAARLMPGGKLPRRETELVILRVAHLRQCTYEYEHHVRLGRRAGVSAADVQRVEAAPSAAGWTPREKAMLVAVDELIQRHDLDDSTWNSLRAHLGPAEAVEFLMLVGHYDMLATFLNTLRVEPDAHS